MSELHINSINDKNFVPDEGQRDLMCSNKRSFRCPSFGTKIYTNEELGNIHSLCTIFRNIRTRLILEGHSIEQLRNNLDEKRK